MNNFDDVQEKAQEMTSGVTSGSPAQTIHVPQSNESSFSYAGYGEPSKPVTKTTGTTDVEVGPQPGSFATPYIGGGSYPGAKIYGAEVDPDPSAVTLKTKFSKVNPYTLSVAGMTGEVDTLNIKKAVAELGAQYEGRAVDMGYWTGYDKTPEPPHENFAMGFVRNLWNSVPNLLTPIVVGRSMQLSSDVGKLYGKVFNDQSAIDAANNMLKKSNEWTDDVLESLRWEYGGGRGVKQNESAMYLGQLVGSMAISLFAKKNPALVFAALEGEANNYYARRAAHDRGVSTLGSISLGLGAGAGTFMLGASTKGVEGITRSLFKPSVGWGIALQNSPKEFVIRKIGEKSLTGLYDSMTESTQDLLSQYLGNGTLEGEDWQQAWLTFVYGAAVAGVFSAIGVKADKNAQLKKNEYTSTILKYFDEGKGVLEEIKKNSHGIITQETIDAYREQLLSGEAQEGFYEFAMNRVAENLDRIENFPDNIKTRLKSIVAEGDGATPLADEMAALDRNIDALLESLTDAPQASKEAIRQFVRGIAQQEYIFRGTAPSKFKLPNIVADVDAKGNPYTSLDTGIVHINKASEYDSVPKSQKLADESAQETVLGEMSARVKNQAIQAAQGSENATFDNGRVRSMTLHELMHWADQVTGLKNVGEFVRYMTAWSENVLPGITAGKKEGSLERSEAYAYAVEYAKSLKDLLGLSGDLRTYIEYIDLFNNVSSANQVVSAFEAYNKMLTDTMKQNAEIVKDLLSAYPDLRGILKQYVDTGNVGIMKDEDMKALHDVLSSVVDANTGETIASALGDMGLARSFIDRYEAEYDAIEEINRKRVEQAKKVIKQKQQQNSPSSVKQQNDLQQSIIENVQKEQPVVENAKEEKPAEAQEGQKTGTTEEPPFKQYTGEKKPLARESKEATWIEKWLSGEKMPVKNYNYLMKQYSAQAMRLVGVLPSKDTKYIVRQNYADNKPTGVMTAVWEPTEEELKSLGLPPARLLNSDQLAAVGRWRALQDVDSVYSIADDIDNITGGGNDNVFYDMVSLKDSVSDDNGLMFIQEAEDIVNTLQDFSGTLTHSGTMLNENDAIFELSFIERAIALKDFDYNTIENEDAKAAIEAFINNINVEELGARREYLIDQIAATQQTDRDTLFLPNKPDNNMYPWGLWKTDTGKAVNDYYTAPRRPITTVLNYGLVDPNSYEVSYWINRMGLDGDKYPSVEVLENIIKEKGLQPVDFSNVTVKIGGKPVNLFEARENQPAEFGTVYGHKGVNQPVTTSFNLKALKEIFNGRPTKDKLVEYLLKSVKDQLQPDVLHLSLEQKLREIAALGRAKIIADNVFAEYNDSMTRFSQWATLSAKGRVALGADIAGLNRETKQENFEKLQNQEVSAGRDAYVARRGLDTKKLPTGLQIAFLYSGSWKQGVITANNIRTDDGNPFYVIRVLNDGEKGTYDLVWDAREFELLQNTRMGTYDSALFTKPFVMDKAEFSKVVSEDYWKENYKPDASDETGGNQYNYTALVADAKLRKRAIPALLESGSEVVDESALYSVGGDDLMDFENDPFPELSDEEFENIDTEYRQRTITGEERTNQEVYDKMKMAEEANRRPVTRYLERNVPGFGKNIVKTIKELTDTIKTRKVSPILFFLTSGSGAQSRVANLFGDTVAKKFGFNLSADRAERVSEDFKKDVEKTLLERTFKNQKELGEWQVKIGVDLDGVKAKMADGFDRAISKDEIMSLYLAELSKTGADPEFKIPFMYGGVIEENGNTYLYNKLRAQYKNFDELIGKLSEQDKQAAQILFRFLPILRNVDAADTTSYFGKFVPVNTFADYTQDGGWDNRKGHDTAVFGTRLVNPDSNLVAVGLYHSAMNMAGAAGLRAYNYLQSVQMLSDMLNLASLANDDVRYSRGFRVDLDEHDKVALNDAIKASEELRQLIADKIGANNFKSFMLALSDSLSKDNSGVAKSWLGEKFQKLTRTASAMALSLKPRQIFTNLSGNYMVLGGLSSHNMLRYNTVDLVNAIAHIREAWEGIKNNGAFRHRWEQAALSEQYRRAADMKADSLLQDIEKVAYEHGKGGVGNTIATLDALAKVMTKYSIGATNTLPDMVGLALGRYVVLEDVKANIAAQAAADGKKMSAEQIAQAAEEQIADYMFSHISSSNVMARGRISKEMARRGFEGLVAFKNDQLQKSASIANAITRYINTDDPMVKKQAIREITGIVLSNAAYVAIQAGLVRALCRSLSGEDLSDKEEEYLLQSLTRESLAQVADTFNMGSVTQPILEAMFLGKESGMDILPFTDINRGIRNVRKGEYLMAGATVAGLAGFSPAERVIQIIRALSMVFGDDERAAQVGQLMLAGRGEATAKNMLGYTTNKAGNIVPKKSNKKKE